MEMAFFDVEKNSKKVGFSKCRSDHFRGPNRRILGQGIGQNLNRTIFEKVQKTVIFVNFFENDKKSSFFDGFLYSKLPMNRPWRPTNIKLKTDRNFDPECFQNHRKRTILHRVMTFSLTRFT